MFMNFWKFLWQKRKKKLKFPFITSEFTFVVPIYFENRTVQFEFGGVHMHSTLYNNQPALSYRNNLWMLIFLVEKSMEEESKSGTKKKESFDGSRKDINIATDRICEFTGRVWRIHLCQFAWTNFWKTQSLPFSGTKIVFWDLREPFIDGLYKPSVFHSRLEALIEPLDTVGVSLLSSFIMIVLST